MQRVIQFNKPNINSENEKKENKKSPNNSEGYFLGRIKLRYN